MEFLSEMIKEIFGDDEAKVNPTNKQSTCREKLQIGVCVCVCAADK